MLYLEKRCVFRALLYDLEEVIEGMWRGRLFQYKLWTDALPAFLWGKMCCIHVSTLVLVWQNLQNAVLWEWTKLGQVGAFGIINTPTQLWILTSILLTTPLILNHLEKGETYNNTNGSAVVLLVVIWLYEKGTFPLFYIKDCVLQPIYC